MISYNYLIDNIFLFSNIFYNSENIYVIYVIILLSNFNRILNISYYIISFIFLSIYHFIFFYHNQKHKYFKSLLYNIYYIMI